MNCVKCFRPIADDVSYCPYCGTKKNASGRKPKRAGNGTGTAYKRGSSWVSQVVIGYRPIPPLDLENPENNRQRIPIKRTHGGFRTKSEALAYCPVLKAGGHLKPVIAPTLQYYWDNYEKNSIAQLSDSKQCAYRTAWNKLAVLHEAHVDQLTVANLRDAVSATCTTYYTAKDCKTVLTMLFRDAAADGYANKDLPSFIQLPSLTEQEREPFSETEQASLWKLYESGDIRAAIPLLMIYTGLMPSEAHELKVEQINLEKRQIIGAGKKTAVRKKAPVILAEMIIPVVEDLIAHARPTGYLFCSSMDLWRKDYYAALEAAKCRRLTPYSCRHTTATALAISEGIAPQTIKKIMRWSSTKMLDRYAHPDQKDVFEAVDRIGASGKNGGKKADKNHPDNVRDHVGSAIGSRSAV